MKKELFLIFCFLLVFIPYCISAEEYSLDDLYRLALKKSETIKISEEDLYISAREKDKALAVLFPTLSAFGRHIRYSEEKSQLNFILQPEYTNEWGFRLDQSLSLSGREFTALNIARDTIMKSTFDLDTVKEGYLLDVASKYYILLRARKAVEIANANVERLTKHRNASEIRLKVGEATKTVLLRAEAELAGAQSDLIRAENHVRLSKAILARTVGLNGDYGVREEPTESSFDMSENQSAVLQLLTEDCEKSTPECLKEKAFLERAELKSMTLQKEIAEKEVTYARGSYWPTLSLEGEYFRQENEPSSSFALTERIYGGVRLNFPFFEGGLRRAEVREAKAKQRQAEYGFSDLKRTIGVEVENSYSLLLTQAALLKQIKAEVDYALDNYNSVSKQFEYGLADSIDVMDANTLLVTSEREFANALYSYQLVILRLQRVTGTLLQNIISQQP